MTILSKLILVCVLFTAGCHRSGTPVKIILPDDYVGRFSITLHRSVGVHPTKEEGFLVYRIPKTGALVVSDLSPFQKWHEEVIQYQNGTVLVSYPSDGYQVRALSTTIGMKKDGTGSGDFDGTVSEWEVYPKPNQTSEPTAPSGRGSP